MPLLVELSQKSRGSFEAESDSKDSWDDQLNSFKSGVSKVFRFFSNIESVESIEGRPGHERSDCGKSSKGLLRDFAGCLDTQKIVDVEICFVDVKTFLDVITFCTSKTFDV